MSTLWNDPMGLKLINWNKPQPPAEPEAPAPPPPAPPCAPAMRYYCYNGFYPQPYFQQQIFIGGGGGPCHHVVAAPPPPALAPAPVHQCVVCTVKNKCKACKKKEDEGKTWISAPTFCNPRTARKGVFDR